MDSSSLCVWVDSERIASRCSKIWTLLHSSRNVCSIAESGAADDCAIPVSVSRSSRRCRRTWRSRIGELSCDGTLLVSPCLELIKGVSFRDPVKPSP